MSRDDDASEPVDAAFRVGPATIDDLDAVTDLWVDLARDQRRHGSTLLARANRPAVREWVARSTVTGELLVARSTAVEGRTTVRSDAGGEPTAVIGFVGFTLERDGYERDHTRGVVSNLYVRPERRGEGVGAALLAAAEDALAEAGVNAVALEALVDNERARSFYAEHGYEPNRVELRKSLDDSGGMDESDDTDEIDGTDTDDTATTDGSTNSG